MVGDRMQTIWTAIRQLDAAGPFTIHQVDLMLSMKTNTVQCIVNRFVKAGTLVVVGEGNGGVRENERLFRVVRMHDRPAAPRIGRDGKLVDDMKSAALWRTMKMLKHFTTIELARNASTPASTVSVQYAGKYCAALVKVGVLSSQRPGYVFVRNLGPTAPRLTKTGKVFDPNANAFVGGADA